MNKEKISNIVYKMAEHFNNGQVLFTDKESVILKISFISTFVSAWNGSSDAKLRSTQVISYMAYNELEKRGYKLTNLNFMNVTDMET